MDAGYFDVDYKMGKADGKQVNWFVSTNLWLLLVSEVVADTRINLTRFVDLCFLHTRLCHPITEDPLRVSVAILHQFNILPDMYQVGYTKLFFRTGQAPAMLKGKDSILKVSQSFVP
ncbi:unnamed protein product [Fraxinus pennsylvanica]|uniref:Uncharacterized protein n=1 Tax=Fraxinus pennsylvanica TaxID=56036 RepID=A0AAD2A503_9LAMI|nr:unnamed protein product [Fraxinus pennsylvanica]